MRPSIYKVDCGCTGDLYIMPKPSGEWLDDDFRAYRSFGITRIISLLTRDETDELGLEEERACCTRHGIEFSRFPIADRGVPDLEAFADLVRQTHGDLINGANVAIHCRIGIGRSGMLASCVLKHFALSAEDAVAAVSAARNVAIPDTDEQLQLIRAYLPNP